MSKQVIINQADLDKLEAVRCALFDFLEEKGLTEDTMDLVKITNITQHMWNLANKKHPVYIPVKDSEIEFKSNNDLATAYICGVTEVDEAWPRPDGFLITLDKTKAKAFNEKDKGYLATWGTEHSWGYCSGSMNWKECKVKPEKLDAIENNEYKTVWVADKKDWLVEVIKDV